MLHSKIASQKGSSKDAPLSLRKDIVQGTFNAGVSWWGPGILSGMLARLIGTPVLKQMQRPTLRAVYTPSAYPEQKFKAPVNFAKKLLRSVGENPADYEFGTGAGTPLGEHAPAYLDMNDATRRLQREALSRGGIVYPEAFENARKGAFVFPDRSQHKRLHVEPSGTFRTRPASKPIKLHPFVVAHEVGHGSGALRGILGRMYLEHHALSKALPLAGFGLLAGAATKSLHDGEVADGLYMAAPVVSALPRMAELAEEARATIRGINMLKKFNIKVPPKLIASQLGSYAISNAVMAVPAIVASWASKRYVESELERRKRQARK